MELTRLIGLVCCAALTAASGAHGQVTYRTVVLSRTDGPLGPGLGEGVQFGIDVGGFHPQTFDTPTIDHLGNIVFTGRVTGDGITTGNRSGVWIVTQNERLMVFRKGDPVPDYPGLVYGEFWAAPQPSNPDGYIPAVVSNGRVAVRSVFAGTGVTDTNNHGVMIWDQGDTRLLMREGDQYSPLGPDALWREPIEASDLSEFTHPLRLTESGLVQFRASVSTPQNSALEGLWYGNGDSPLTNIILEDSVPPTIRESDTQVQFVQSRHTASGNYGSAFSIQWDGSTFGRAAYIATSSGLDRMARSGDSLPGIENATFNSFNIIDSNAQGQVLVFTESIVDGIGGIGNSGYWRWNDHQLEIIVQEGLSLPTGGGIVDSLWYAKMNTMGSVTYQVGSTTATLYVFDDLNGHSFVASPTSLTAQFGLNVNFIGIPVMNRHGQIAFGSLLSSNGIAEDVFDALFATGRDGTIHQIVQSGDIIEVAEGDQRTVQWIYYARDSGGDDGQRMSLNDRGELVYRVQFGDGSGGIFVATIDPIICPGDVTYDFEIDVDDLNVVLSSWSMSVTPGTAGDVDGTGFVDVDDLNLVLGAWGTVCN